MSQTLGDSIKTGMSSKSVNKDDVTNALALMGVASAAGKSTAAGVSIPASESWLTESLTKESHLVESHFVENRLIETGFINRPAALWRPSAELDPTLESCGRDANDILGSELRSMHADKRVNKQRGRGARLVMTQRDMV